jgi:hypothetical protein
MRTSIRPWIFKSVILVVCGLMCSCDRLSNWVSGNTDIAPFVTELKTADRMVVQDKRSDVVKDTSQPDDLAAVISFIQNYPTDWNTAPGGTGGDYEMTFHRGKELLVGGVGLTSSIRFPGQDTVHAGQGFRQVPKDDVVQLTTKLGLKWPTTR